MTPRVQLIQFSISESHGDTLEHKMHLILLFAAIYAVRADDSVVCDGIIFHGVYFDREPIVQNIGSPYNLFLHKFSGMLFFSQTTKNGTLVDFIITTCHIDTRVCQNVGGIPGGYAIAYDQGNDDIYLGGHDGIYKYNFLTKSAEFFAEEGKSIWGLFVRKNFYYIRYPTQKLYVYHDADFVQVAEAYHIEIDHFHISKQSDLYFSNKTALYKIENPTKQTIVLSDEISVRQIVEDGYGDVYFCGSDGIYIEDNPFRTVKKIARIDHAFGMTFDENEHLIYSDKNTIYRLKPSKNAHECFEQLNLPIEREEMSEIRRFLISR